MNAPVFRCLSGVIIGSVEHISNFFLVFFSVNFEQVNVSRVTIGKPYVIRVTTQKLL